MHGSMIHPMKRHGLTSALVSVGVMALLTACDDDGPASRSVIKVADLMSPTRDANDKTWIAAGDPSKRFATLAEAKAAGQVCGQAVERVGACGAGLQHHAQVVLTGAYLEDGAAVDADSFVNPCAGAGDCMLPFVCEPGVDTTVEFNLTVTRDARQGFLDIAVSPRATQALSELCVSIAAEDGEGVTTWLEQNICSTEFGNGAGDITYIKVCNSEAPATKVHLWIESLTGVDPGAAFINPCPAEGHDRAKACTVAATCVENGDVLVEFELELELDP
jgi:hypothetical protein